MERREIVRGKAALDGTQGKTFKSPLEQGLSPLFFLMVLGEAGI